MEEYTRAERWVDRWTDWTYSHTPPFCYCGMGNNNVKINQDKLSNCHHLCYKKNFEHRHLNQFAPKTRLTPNIIISSYSMAGARHIETLVMRADDDDAPKAGQLYSSYTCM